MITKVVKEDYAYIRGFNYQPSYASMGFEVWEQFDPEVWRRELGRGKQYFPEMNTIRFWLDTQSYFCNPQSFAQKLETVLQILAEIGCKAMPTLFNRWHTTGFNHDVGGVYVDHFWPRANLGLEVLVGIEKGFDGYVKDIVLPHKNDSRILMWDLCNEPQLRSVEEMTQPEKQAEYQWLSHIYDVVKSLEPSAPVTIGALSYGDPPKILEPLMDVICCHPYDGWDDGKMADGLNELVALANEKGKPLIANETCCGSLDDTKRVKIIEKTLKLLKDRGIGFLPWILHHSRVPHANREFCPGLEYMAFIKQDGTLRAGHKCFNEW